MESFLNYLLLSLRILFAASVYLFLAWALLTMRQWLKAGEKYEDTAFSPALRLIFDDQLLGEREFAQSQVYLGRAASCECVIDHETVSARHCRFAYHHGQWWLEDAGSKNGTFLNERRVRQATVLSPGDAVRCGKVAMRIRIDAQAL